MPDDGLRVELRLPWACTQRDLSAQARATHWQQTLLLLRVLNLMQPQAPREAGAEALTTRLEAKLDLALHLLARLIGGGTPAPAPAAITLSAEGCRLPAKGPLQTAEPCLVQLYPESSLPLPLELPAVVTASAGVMAALSWLDMPETVREAWEQWLFRQHRRVVQAQRRPG
ncbi:MAG: PilZ domain-containing protein [Thiobacillaceae bacterium]